MTSLGSRNRTASGNRYAISGHGLRQWISAPCRRPLPPDRKRARDRDHLPRHHRCIDSSRTPHGNHRHGLPRRLRRLPAHHERCRDPAGDRHRVRRVDRSIVLGPGCFRPADGGIHPHRGGLRRRTRPTQGVPGRTVPHRTGRTRGVPTATAPRRSIWSGSPPTASRSTQCSCCSGRRTCCGSPSGW